MQVETKGKMQVEVKGDNLIITIPFDKNGRDSASGKTSVHATSNGNKETSVLVNGKALTVGVNAYTKK